MGGPLLLRFPDVIDVRLREVRPEDLPVLYANQADAEVARQAAVPLRTREAFFAHWQKLLGDDAVNHRAVLLDGALAGCVVAWNREGQRLVGYQLGRAHWGRGAGSAALRQFLSVEKARPLFAEVAERNTASVRVLEKCGFLRQGSAMLTEAGDTFVELHFRLDA
jgi:RimJ/RimL family protein N-acetyltransferase